MDAPNNNNAGRQPGVKTTHQASITDDFADIVAEKQPIKPEVDLLSWAALGGNAKPSRTDRRAKSARKRDRK